MLGAIIGDIVGSRFEFNPTNDYNFELFGPGCDYTDDTICTIAVADAVLHGLDFGETLHKWCRKYPNPMGGYGISFAKWVKGDNPQPYNSFGNGAAMRVSAIGWLPNADTIRFVEAATQCTHNHPEGIKGAQTVALAIQDCLQMHGQVKYIDRMAILEYGLPRALKYSKYDIHIDINNVRNRFDETCQGTVPVALWIITESHSFEDAIRRAVSLGADADTLGAIVGSIAEAIWGIPEWMKKKAMSYLPVEMKLVLKEFRDQSYWHLSKELITKEKSTEKKRQELINQCLYYKGEENSPFNNDIDRYWCYERVWVRETINETDYMKGMIADLRQRFPNAHYPDNAPEGLLAIFLNRIEHWGGICETIQPIYNMYDEYKAFKEDRLV